MCIIIYKDKDVNLPNSNFLKECFKANEDGAGLMYQRANTSNKDKITINKGFMTFSEFDKAYKDLELTKSDTIVYHFRKSTSDIIAPSHTHPFPIAKTRYRLYKTYTKTHQAIAHNGTIDLEDKILSDTQLFILNVLSKLSNNLDKPAIEWLIENSINKSRLVIFDNGIFRFYGSWKEQENGLWLSRNLYRKTSWSNWPEWYNKRYDYDNDNIYNDSVFNDNEYRKFKARQKAQERKEKRREQIKSQYQTLYEANQERIEQILEKREQAKAREVIREKQAKTKQVWTVHYRAKCAICSNTVKFNDTQVNSFGYFLCPYCHCYNPKSLGSEIYRSLEHKTIKTT